VHATRQEHEPDEFDRWQQSREGVMVTTTATEMTIEHVVIESLELDPGNPRRISDADLESLTRSIREFGLVDPILARRANRRVIGGHQRLLAARRLGMKIVPAIFLDVGEKQARLLNVALNQISGAFEPAMLARMLSDLSAVADLDLTLTGFGEDDLDKLLKSLDVREKKERAESFDLDAALEAARAATRAQRGELWALGDPPGC
jgi:ParB-like chromosome segregation protein Spo0J